jgi:hypothetical protein
VRTTILDLGITIRLATLHPEFAQKVHGGTIRAKRANFRPKF